MLRKQPNPVGPNQERNASLLPGSSQTVPADRALSRKLTLLQLLWPYLLLPLNNLLKLGLVFRLAPRPRFRIHHARRFGLTNPLARVGFHRLGGRKLPWLAFRHRFCLYPISVMPSPACVPLLAFPGQ